MSKVSFVSADGHAVMPVEVWPQYLEQRYHEYLPAFHRENDVNARAMYPLNDMMMVPAADVFDVDGQYRSEGWRGAWDRDVRLAQMDREGVAAEVVYHGFFRVSDLGFSVMCASYPPDVVDAGARAYDRWAYDVFGDDPDRLLLVGAMGACTDVEATMRQVEWVADHGFVGTYAPGFVAVPGVPPLDDESWDPLWALYADRGVTLVVHGGYGLPQGFAYERIDQTLSRIDAEGGSELDLVMALVTDIFNHDFVADLRHRRAMWQLMVGGVFDRHPALKLLMTEVRADWIPATLRHFDALYDELRDDLRDDLRSRRRPSEWWESNCLAGASFMHKAEVEMLDEIGADRVTFGRDYPHAEGTWPNTIEYLRDLFSGVPESDVRKILGENAIRFFGLDAARIAAIAERIGPEICDITNGPATDARLIEHLGERCGYLKPAEGGSRLGELDALLADDLARMRQGSAAPA
jgi:predicted TIM-barrel fold metal-dependent hydrolase